MEGLCLHDKKYLKILYLYDQSHDLFDELADC